MKDGDREVEFLAKVPLGAIEVTSDAARGAYAAHLSFVAFIKDEAGRPVGGPGRFRAQGGTLPFEMATGSRGVRLSLDLDDPEGIPYFLWDEPMTLSVLRGRLQSASRGERLRLLGRILREARDTDVWRFTTPAEVVASWPELQRYLGRRREFWQFLLERWQDLGLDGHSS